MLERSAPETIFTGLTEHPAVKAWRRFDPRAGLPSQVVTLKPERRKSAVYRLQGVGPRGTIIAKRSNRSTIAVETTVYVTVLRNLPYPTLEYFGTVEEPDSQLSWIFIEDACGSPYSAEDPQHRSLAARWLALLHTTAQPLRLGDTLPRSDLDSYYGLLRLTRETLIPILNNSSLVSEDRRTLGEIVDRCAQVESCRQAIESLWSKMPQTIVRGGFVEKNVQVAERNRELVLLPFDWENAGWGVPAVDIAYQDLEVYAPAVSHRWTDLSLGDLRVLADIGRAFFAFKSIPGEARSFTFPWVEKVMKKMRFYSKEIVSACHQLQLMTE